MINSADVTILMATYNGEHYIKQQLDSLLNQTYANWKLIIRDDGSTDNTTGIIEEYISNHRNISLVINETSLKGAVSNFSALYALVRHRQPVTYVMFCDQDDIWLPEKIEMTIALMQDTEKKEPGKAVLIYGNMQLMTEDGTLMTEEMKLMSELSFNRTLAQNYAFGCTMMINCELVKIMDDIPITAENHDYWISLVATAFGTTRYLEKSYLYYRQHSNNVTSQGASLKKRIARFTTGFNKQIETLKKRKQMLQKFLDVYQAKLAPDKLNVLKGYVESFNKGRLNVIYNIGQNKIYKLGPLQNIGLIYTIFFFYGKILAGESGKQNI